MHSASQVQGGEQEAAVALPCSQTSSQARAHATASPFLENDGELAEFLVKTHRRGWRSAGPSLSRRAGVPGRGRQKAGCASTPDGTLPSLLHTFQNRQGSLPCFSRVLEVRGTSAVWRTVGSLIPEEVERKSFIFIISLCWSCELFQSADKTGVRSTRR